MTTQPVSRTPKLSLPIFRAPRWFLLLLFIALHLAANGATSTASLSHRTWKIDGVTREALLHIPSKAQNAPVVFGFHGHGGTMRNAARSFQIETLWPEAIVVYMQGLNTPGHITDPEGKKPGWQRTQGDQNDRDLHFFDAVLGSLIKEYGINTNRVYATGHSNGGAFTYLLLETRADYLTAFAPCAALHLPLIRMSRKEFESALAPNDSSSTKSAASAKPPGNGNPPRAKSVFHIAAENDELVKFAWQKRFLDQFRLVNDCGSAKPWPGDKRCTFYDSKNGVDLVTYVHPGTHKYPSEAPELIVKFFKER